MQRLHIFDIREDETANNALRRGHAGRVSAEGSTPVMVTDGRGTADRTDTAELLGVAPRP
jgi:hypothetical protein